MNCLDDLIASRHNTQNGRHTNSVLYATVLTNAVVYAGTGKFTGKTISAACMLLPVLLTLLVLSDRSEKRKASWFFVVNSFNLL